MAEVSVVIVSYKVKELLKDCLESLFAHTRGVSFSVVVVDNASKDGSVGMVENSFPQVRLIKNNANLGFAKANNQAIQKIRSPYILFLNPDTYITADIVYQMYSYMKNHHEVALSGPILLREDGSIQPSAYKRYPNLFITFLEYCMPLQFFLLSLGIHPHNLKIRASEKDAVEIAHLLGACFMVKKDALDEISTFEGQPPFDERFFIHREETDLCVRLKRRGYKLVVLPWVNIYHYGAKSTESLGVAHTAASPYFLKSLYLYHKKYHPHLFNALFLAIGVLLGSLITFISAFIALPLTLFSAEFRKKIRVYLLIPVKIFRWHLSLQWLN